MRKEQGFGVIEIVIVIVVVALLGIGGWWVYTNQNKTAPQPNPAGNETTQLDQSKTSEPPYEGYLVVKEWGVKLKMQDAEKVTYTYKGNAGSDSAAFGKYESYISLAVKDEYLQDKTCTVSVGMSRYSADTIDKAHINIATKIGDYYYIVGGSPYNCGNEPDNTLNQRVRADFDHKKLEAL